MQNDPRSRWALLQMLQQQGDMGPVRTAGEGAAKAGSMLVNAMIAKQLMGEDRQRADNKNAAISQLLRGDFNAAPAETKSYADDGTGKPGTIEWAAKPADETGKSAAMAEALGPEQALLQRLKQSEPAYTDVAGVGLVNTNATGGPKTVISVPAKPASQSTIGQMMAERDALPQGDPRRKTYDDAIAKDTTREPKAAVIPATKSVFDKALGKNRFATEAEVAQNPGNFSAPVQAPQIKLFNTAGQEIGTGDPNDPDVQARITKGEVRTAPPRQFSGEQSKAAGFANDALTSEANVEKLLNPRDKDGKPMPSQFDPTGIWQGWSLSNATASKEKQLYDQAKANWGMAVLRQESGGAITPAEGLAYAETFFPRVGESKEVIEQKRLQRKEKMDGIVAASGGAYEANFGKKEPAAPAPVKNATSIPAVGTIEDGHRFKGGDPSDPNNWEPVA